MRSTRFPDLEGIETILEFLRSEFTHWWSTRFPDLEGIETRDGRVYFAGFFWSTRFPDLEGIETPIVASIALALSSVD